MPRGGNSRRIVFTPSDCLRQVAAGCIRMYGSGRSLHGFPVATYRPEYERTVAAKNTNVGGIKFAWQSGHLYSPGLGFQTINTHVYRQRATRQYFCIRSVTTLSRLPNGECAETYTMMPSPHMAAGIGSVVQCFPAADTRAL